MTIDVSRYLKSILLVAAAMLCASNAGAQKTALFFDGQPSDYVGAGVLHRYLPAGGTFSAVRNYRNGIPAEVDGPPRAARLP